MPATTHIVEQGDTMISIAYKYAFRDWKTIWDDSSNSSLKQIRSDPQVLYPGDQVNIPEKTPAKHKVQTGSKHIFKVKAFKAYIRIIVKDSNDEPYKKAPYEITVDGKAYPKKSTDDKGLVEQEVPASAKKAKLKLWHDPSDTAQFLEWDLDIGQLDPVEETSGIKARLRNLGYNPGPIDSSESEEFTEALSAFQRDNEIQPVTGKPDHETLNKLKEKHEQ